MLHHRRIQRAVERAYGVSSEWSYDILTACRRAGPDTVLGRYAREQVARAVRIRHATRREES